MGFLDDETLSDSEKVKQYLLNKGRDQAEAQNQERQSGLGWAQFGAGLGDAIAGRSPDQTAKNFDGFRKNIKDETIGEYDRQKKAAIEDYSTKRSVNQNVLKDDLNSEESKMARTLALDMGMDPKMAGTMTASQFENLSPYLKAKYEAKIRELDRRELRADRTATRDIARQDRLDKITEKREDRDLTLAVPGYERTGQVLPKAEEAVKFRKAVATSKQLSDKLNRLRDLVGGNKEKGITGVGSYEYGGNAGTEMESLATEIQLLSKSPELYELGVLTGPDMSLLEKVIANPTSLDSLFTRDGSRLKQIDSQLNSINGKLGATAESLGYAKAGGEKAPPRMVRIKDPRGIIRNIPADQAQAAINAGGTLIDRLAGQ